MPMHRRVALGHSEAKEDGSQLLVLIDQCRDVIDAPPRCQTCRHQSVMTFPCANRTMSTRLEALLDCSAPSEG